MVSKEAIDVLTRQIDMIERAVEKKVGNYASHCRKIPTIRISNDKKKGSGNGKCGNQYLAWAFGEAAECALRYDAQAKAFYESTRRRTNVAVAHGALAHKLARAAYYIMRDGVAFVSDKAFA